MARLFRFLEKKRGTRRTGSNLAGSVGEALFFGALFLLGVGTLSSLLGPHDPGTYDWGKGGWLLILVAASFAIMGGAGLIWTAMRVGVSAERRSVMARTATELDPLSDTLSTAPEYPGLPELSGLINSPGVELSYRLPQTESAGWRLLASTVFALIWNAVACVITVWAIRGHLSGQGDWLFTLFLFPFVAIGGWSVYYLLRLIVIHTGMGPTTVEVSDLPLHAGREYRVAVWQQGHIRVFSFEVCLVCEEEATYHQGTDCRTEVREVFRRVVFEQADFLIEPIQPFQCTFLLTIPADAMHSFQGLHNSVQWRLVVRGSAEGWPEFRRAFPLVVYPGAATSQLKASPPAVRTPLIPYTPAMNGGTNQGAIINGALAATRVRA
ncbi:hypothetical protein [Anatilimnocola aggregata]|uniref:hypothetical protein n=1 Tax=Anatilimnocola aggregata TaxID=2528021 RepID=UPI0011A04045|nr:hypothetical protein [Anatilimnocola aggregata]